MIYSNYISKNRNFPNIAGLQIKGTSKVARAEPDDSNEFNKPEDIHVDEQNRLYVVDKGNKRVQIFQVTISNE